MLKLKLQYFGHLMQRTDSLEKTLMLGKIEGRGDCLHLLVIIPGFFLCLDSILKSRDITLTTKVHIVKAMVFPVVMYGYKES